MRKRRRRGNAAAVAEVAGEAQRPPPALRVGTTVSVLRKLGSGEEQRETSWQDAEVLESRWHVAGEGEDEGEPPQKKPRGVEDGQAKSAKKGGAAHPCAEYLLRYEGGGEKWTALAKRTFFVCPPRAAAGSEDTPAATQSTKDEERSAIMAVHFEGVPRLEATSVQRPKRAPRTDYPEGWQQREYLEKVRKAESIAAAATIIVENLERLDPRNLAASLNRLARSVPFKAHKEVALAAVKACVTRASEEALEGYTPTSIANICWALSRLGFRCSGRPEDEAAEHILGLGVRKAWHEIRRGARERRGQVWGSWAPVDIAMLCGALGKTTSPGGVDSSSVRRFLRVVAQGVALTRWSGFSAQELANAFSTLGSWDAVPPLLMRKTLAKLQKHRDMFGPQECCVVILAATKGGAPRELVRPVLQAAVEDAAKKQLRGYNSVDLFNLMWSLGARGAADAAGEMYKDADMILAARGFIAQVVERARSDMKSFKPEELAGLVYSLSRLGLYHAEFMGQISAQWRLWFATACSFGARMPTTLCNVLSACARLGHSEPALAAAICERASDALSGVSAGGKPSGGWTLLNITDTAWASALILAAAAEDGSSEQGGELAVALRKLLRAVCEAALRLGPREASKMHVAHSALRAWEAGAPRDGAVEAAWQPPDGCASKWRKAFRMDGEGHISKFQAQVGEVLRSEVLPELFPQGCTVQDEVLVGDLTVDMVLKPKGAAKSIVVEADGPTHFVTPISDPTSRALNGATRFRMWLLRWQGVLPVSVPDDKFKARLDRQAKYLTKLLRHVASECMGEAGDAGALAGTDWGRAGLQPAPPQRSESISPCLWMGGCSVALPLHSHRGVSRPGGGMGYGSLSVPSSFCRFPSLCLFLFSK